MSGFDTIVVVDWSARATPSPARPSKDAIWIGVARDGRTACQYHRTRSAAMTALEALFDAELAEGRRVMAGFDFPFAYPRGFAEVVAGRADPLALWAELATLIEDGDDNANNRFAVALALNRLFPGVGPFWGGPEAETGPELPAKGTDRQLHGLPEKRGVERRVPRAQPCWKLFTTGSVGSQALLGIPRLQALRQRYGAVLSVAPFESAETPIKLVEVFPSLIADAIKVHSDPDEIPDRAQVRILAGALARLAPEDLADMLEQGDAEEGWILGVGREDDLRVAARDAVAQDEVAQDWEGRLRRDAEAGVALQPPPLRNDCFALPAGVDWTPVDDALGLLQDRLSPVVGRESVAVMAAGGRVLATDLHAIRANPPHPNTAVDGWGFDGRCIGSGPQRLTRLAGRAAAGSPFDGAVPPGSALRVLTGADLPKGVDTVVLDEDVAVSDAEIAFYGPLRAGANTRRAGEDVQAQALALAAGRLLTPADLALAAAVGHGTLEVFQKLRVAVMSTGDELVEAGGAAGPGQIFDANRPMLLRMIERWGFAPIDMGRVGDDRAALRAALDMAAERADVILTSGGASAGDEDHVSALLREAGAMQEWRIALKPGRPLALGMWQGVPVFGLPGNPVAALVCALIFARPAMGILSGTGWSVPQGYDLPAAFEKKKKPGRREYLRARVRDGRVEVFGSEGSGRISGLSWAEGLVEIGDDARIIRPGDPVRYLPFESFGL